MEPNTTLYALSLLPASRHAAPSAPPAPPAPLLPTSALPPAPPQPAPHPAARVAYVSITSKYARTMVLRRLRARGWTCVGSGQAKAEADLQFAEYERIMWESVLGGKRAMANAYCVRRGLTRKAALAQVCTRWVDKFGDATCLSKSVPLTVVVSTWDAFDTESSWLAKQFGIRDPLAALKECLWEAEDAIASQGGMWVLKPSIASKGAEVTPLATVKELRDVVLAWPDVREWVLQRYVPRLLLLDGGRKFHLRVFIVCVGALRVHLLTDYIAFFATDRFAGAEGEEAGAGAGAGAPPGTTHFAHITNAAHQKNHPDFVEADSFRSSRELVDVVARDLKLPRAEAEFHVTHPDGKILLGITECVREVFRALQKQPAVFQPVDNCFEHYGLDFLVDQDLRVHLLEFNSGPDLEQAGDRLKPIIETLLDGVVDLGVERKDASPGFVCIYDEVWQHAQDMRMEVRDGEPEEG